MTSQILFFFIGIALLYFGGELLVSKTSSLAKGLGMSTVTIALTVVAFGTSAPELAASISAALKGSSAISLGNVIGSNLFNLGVILGISALINPMNIQRHFVKMELPFLIIITSSMAFMAWDGLIGRGAGVLLLTTLVLYIYSTFKMTKKEPNGIDEKADHPIPVILKDLIGVVIGIAMLVIGADLLVDSAIYMARSFGLEERIIGITIVAFGTSLPELASCVIAALKGESGFILGNLIGSNIFNILAIIGTTVVIRPMTFSGHLFHIDLISITALTTILGFFLYTGYRLSRKEGFFLLMIYCLYFLKVII